MRSTVRLVSVVLTVVLVAPIISTTHAAQQPPQASAQAFEPLDFWLADFIRVKIQHAFPIVTFDGKDLGEDGLQAEVLAFGLGHLGLQKLLIGVGLQLDQVWGGNDLFNLAEVNSFSGSQWHLDL